MSQKIQVTIDANKLRKLVSKRSYENRDGETINLQEVKFDLVELKEDSKKVVYDADKYILEKTHFAVAQQTKEEREAKKEAFFIGEGISFVWKDQIKEPESAIENYEVEEEESDDLPF